MKPNSLFSLTASRSSFKPNSLFALTAAKRSSFKPNIVLKPNGLFSLTKRGEEFETDPDTLRDIQLNKMIKRGLKPNGLFNLRKKAMKPNGLFSLAKKDVMEDEMDLTTDEYEYSYENDGEKEDAFVDEVIDADELDVEQPVKR